MAQTACKRANSGSQIKYTALADVIAGQVIVVGSIPMIAPVPIASGAEGVLEFVDAWDVPKATGAWTQGDAIYWDDNGSPVLGDALSGAFVTTASGNYLAGFAAKDAASGVAMGKLVLTASRRTAAIAGSMTADDITGSDATLNIGGLQAAQGGTVPIQGGTSTTSANAGGAVSLAGGTPGATGVGGAAAVAGGIGGSTSGTGGAATVAGGAGTAGNANGGAASVRGGDAHGSGTDGVVDIGTSNTSQINVGVASIPTAMPGPVNRVAGASTVAAGSTTADAGVLPAATSSVYPTSAADDTRGVRVHANDKVTGRALMVGNGVSNKILKVYAPSGGAINGAAADAAFSGASGKGVMLHCLDSVANTWLAW